MKKRCLAFITLMLFTLSFIGTARVWDSKVYAYSDAQEVAALTNQERAKKGLSLLRYSDELSQAADVRAQEIANKFSHKRPDGRDSVTVMEDLGLGYSYFGENIAYGPEKPVVVVGAWMDSSAHRSNILKGGYNCIGVGVTYTNGTYYWVQLFATSRSLSGTVITMSGEDTVTTTAKSTTTATAKSTTTASTTSAAPTSVSTSVTTAATTATSSYPTTSTAAQPTAPTETTSSASVAEESPKQQSFWARIVAFFKRIFGRE